MSDEEEKGELPEEKNLKADSLGSDSRPVLEVHGSERTIEQYGPPSTFEGDERLRYVFYPTWRSQVVPLFFYALSCVLCVWLTHKIPASVIEGKLFTIGDTVFFLHLPLLAFIPGALVGKVLLYVYDSKYIIDDGGVEAQIGLVSMYLRQPRLRWEDIRGVEPNQTLWERILGIGSVLVGSAMTQDVEIVMEGVDNPRAIQLLIGGERDRRLKNMVRGGNAHSQEVFGD